MTSHLAEPVSGVPRFPPLARVARVGLGLAFLVVAASALNEAGRQEGGVSIVWLSNGLLIGVLLSAPHKQWPAFLCLGYLIDIAVNLAQHNGLGMSAWFSVCNMTEVVLASSLMYRAVAPHPDLTEGRQLRSLLLYGVLLAPAVTAFLASLSLRVVFGTPFSQTLQYWFAADVLGIATATPL
jgi:integral membrane sensor domain MASE1